MIKENGIEEHLIKDEQNDKLITAEKRQLTAKTCLYKKLNIEKVNMTATIALSGLSSLGLDEILSEYAGSLPRNLINLKPITQYLNSVDKCEGGKKS